MPFTQLILGSVTLKAQIPFKVIPRNPGVLIQGRGIFIPIPGKRAFKVWDLEITVNSDADKTAIEDMLDGQPYSFSDGITVFNNGTTSGKAVIMNGSLEWETFPSHYKTNLLLFEYDQT